MEPILLSLARRTYLVVAVAALASACSPAAAPAGVPTPTAAGPTSAAAATPTPTGVSTLGPSGSPTPAVSATPGGTAPATSKPNGAAQVDLTFTGAFPLTAKGTGGQCRLSTPSSGGLPSFGFEATEADFPGLGQSFSLLQFAGSDAVDLKWVIDGDNAYGQAGPIFTAGPNTITSSADHHSVTLDAQLSGLAPQGKPIPGAGHVTGTITCP